jgi:hypothetical protein
LRTFQLTSWCRAASSADVAEDVEEDAEHPPASSGWPAEAAAHVAPAVMAAIRRH